MATALSMITRAMRLAQVATKGEALDNDEAQDGLVALHAMLDSWQIDKLFVYAINEESFTWAANQASQTVGSGGDFNTTLPTRLADDLAFRIGNVDYPAKIINVDAWTAIPDKTSTNTWAWWIYPVYSPTLITLNAYPVPSAATTFLLRSLKALQSFATLTTALSLPPGYQRAIEYSLAEEFGPEFGVTIDPQVRQIAAAARRAIRRINSLSPIMSSEAGRMGRSHWSYVYGDIP